MDILHSPERHGHPALDVGILKDELLVADYGLKISVEELENEIDVLLD
jgi:hypothetical protein